MLSASVISDGMVKVNSTGGAFRQCRLGIEEDPAGADVLGETSHGSVLNLNRDRQVDLESLTGPTLHPNRLCTHRKTSLLLR